MKKFCLCLFMVLFVFCFNANAMQNPWITCSDDLGFAMAQSGVKFPLRVENYTVRAMKDLIEITFPLDKKRMVTVRKSSNFDGPILPNGIVDISGDFNHYKINKLTYLKNGIAFWTRGEKKKFYVVAFAAENGFYSFSCPQGLKLKDLEYFYNLLVEAEAPRFNYDEEETLTIEQLQDLRRVDGIVEPVYTQDYMPEVLRKKGVTQKCFDRANLNQDTFCSTSEIIMIKEYYR